MSHSFPGNSITTKGAVNQNVILCLCQTKNICVAFLLADSLVGSIESATSLLTLCPSVCWLVSRSVGWLVGCSVGLS